MIYLDHAATTPMSDEAISVYEKVARSYFGNPSSVHDAGDSARQIIDTVRRTLAEAIGVPGREKGIYFTGSGSEANERAIRSLLRGRADRRHLITSSIEHSCVHYTMQELEREGYRVDYLPVDDKGYVDPGEVRDAIRDDTALVSVHHVHPEIGTVQPIRQIAEITRPAGVLLHSDCVQSFARIPVNASEIGLDALSVSAHKLHGPKGLGAVWIDPSVFWKGTPGVSQQGGFRQGTLDVPGIAAFMAAVKEQVSPETDSGLLEKHRQLVEGIRSLPFDCTLEGDPEHGAPGIVGLRIHGVEGQYAMLECNRNGLAFSTGSACTVGSTRPSRTMTAIGHPEQESREFIRLSIGKNTTDGEIRRALEIMGRVISTHFSLINP